jgi:hypothetical protein
VIRSWITLPVPHSAVGSTRRARRAQCEVRRHDERHASYLSPRDAPTFQTNGHFRGDETRGLGSSAMVLVKREDQQKSWKRTDSGGGSGSAPLWKRYVKEEKGAAGAILFGTPRHHPCGKRRRELDRPCG